MLKIAICDDIEKELKKIEHLILEYMTEKGEQFEIILFKHPDELLQSHENEHYSIYILDIVMPMINGIELGKEIRRMDCECQIIYVTTEPEYALASFATNPANYLIKPVEREMFFHTLDFVIPKINKDVDEIITVKCKEGMRVVNLLMIICCEYREHRIIYHLNSGEQILSMTLRIGFTEQLATLLENKRFIQTHSSYICNMNAVEKMTGSEFFLRGGMVVPISKKIFAEVRNTYLDYRLGKEENL